MVCERSRWSFLRHSSQNRMSFEKNDFCSPSRCDFVWYADRNTFRRKETWNQLHSRILIDTQGISQMNIQNIKKYAFSLALAVGFVIAPGLSSLSAVQAQGWDRDRRDDRWDDRRRDRWDDDRWDDRRERREEYKGYRDGLDSGQRDARRNRRPDLYGCGQYRNGSRDYREGFRRGYFQGYRQYARYERW
jgi:hypothetical protein